MIRCECKIIKDPKYLHAYGDYDAAHPNALIIEHCSLHRAAEDMLSIINDLNYVLTWVWAPGYKRFHDHFSERCKTILVRAEDKV